MKKWSHLHSAGTGALLALAFATHLWTLLALVFIAGILLGRFWNLIHWSGEALRFRVLRARAERIEPGSKGLRPEYTGKRSEPTSEISY